MRRVLIAFTLIAAACGSDPLRVEEPADALAFALVFACPADFALAYYPGYSADRNGDGYHCYLAWKDENGNAHLVEIDNNVPVNTIGTCPGQFEAVGALAGNPVDRNQNGVVCELRHQNGNITTIDDNHEGAK